MNYLQDKRNKKNNFLKISVSLSALIILVYFRAGIYSGLSRAGGRVFRPVLGAGSNLGNKLAGTVSFFISKNSLLKENEDLKYKLSEQEARMSNYDSVLADNESLKEILSRKNPNTSMTLAAILSKPNQSPYDTLVIDAGEKENIKKGALVFTKGDVPIGRIAEVLANSSKVILFSNSGEKTEAVIGSQNFFIELVGRGGGNFEMVLQRDITLVKGDQAVLPGIFPYVLAKVETIISDPRDPFTKALLVSPVNIQELKFVEVQN